MKSVKDYNSYVKLIRAVVMVVVCFTVIYVVTLAGKSRINNYKSSENQSRMTVVLFLKKMKRHMSFHQEH